MVPVRAAHNPRSDSLVLVHGTDLPGKLTRSLKQAASAAAAGGDIPFYWKQCLAVPLTCTVPGILYCDVESGGGDVAQLRGLNPNHTSTWYRGTRPLCVISVAQTRWAKTECIESWAVCPIRSCCNHLLFLGQGQEGQLVQRPRQVRATLCSSCVPRCDRPVTP